jgi:quercetin dioxygenase-like cupin family protein
VESSIQQIMNPILFQTTDWSDIPVEQKQGESGSAIYRAIEFENFRVRLVEYSPNYRANHWCKTGHIVFCLEGEMISELSDGRSFRLSKGMSYVVSDDVSNHRSISASGVKLIIIDGDFLKKKSETAIFNPWRM